MRLSSANHYLSDSLDFLPFTYAHVKGTWTSPMLGSIILPLKALHLPVSRAWEGRGTATEGILLATQQPGQQHPNRSEITSVAGERGEKKHLGSAAQANTAQGRHV